MRKSVLLAILMIWMVSCNQDDNETPLIVGEWTSPTYPTQLWMFTLDSVKIVSTNDTNFVIEEGRYTHEGDVLLLHIDDNNSNIRQEYKDVSVGESLISLTYTTLLAGSTTPEDFTFSLVRL